MRCGGAYKVDVHKTELSVILYTNRQKDVKRLLYFLCSRTIYCVKRYVGTVINVGEFTFFGSEGCQKDGMAEGSVALMLLSTMSRVKQW